MSDFRLIEFGLAIFIGKAEFALFYVCLVPRTHVLFMIAFFCVAVTVLLHLWGQGFWPVHRKPFLCRVTECRALSVSLQ